MFTRNVKKQHFSFSNFKVYSLFQVRQWQHWGSGCYKYFCEAGRLHIEVLNNTYTCFYPQQVLIL